MKRWGRKDRIFLGWFALISALSLSLGFYPRNGNFGFLVMIGTFLATLTLGMKLIYR